MQTVWHVEINGYIADKNLKIFILNKMRSGYKTLETYNVNKKIIENYTSNLNKFYSQTSQDEWLENNVFKGYKNGVFIDVGAHDGKKFNNTLYFEQENNWTGINIEPIEKVYNELLLNRPNCINLNIAIDENNGEADFIINSGYTEMLSGLKNYYDDRHLNRMNSEISQYGGETKTIKVVTQRLETVLDKYNIKHINYLSIDVEGAEYSVIKSINFDKVFIDVIGFENNYSDIGNKIIKYLETKGYKIIYNNQDVFMINKESKFNK